MVKSNWFAMNEAHRQFDFADLMASVPMGISRLVVDPDTALYRQGESAKFMCYLVSGRIKLSAVSPRGREAIVSILDHDEFFGEDCLLGYSTRCMTAVALNKCHIIKIRKEIACALVGKNVGFDEFLIIRLIESTNRIAEQLLDRIFNSSERRLARALLSLANYGTKGTPDITIPKLSQEMLAEMVGTTRPRINQFMNKFRDLGYIDYDSSTITVHHTLLRVLLSENGCRSAHSGDL